MKASSFKQRAWLAGSAVAVSLALVACGGGGSGNFEGSDVSLRATQDSGRAFSFTADLAGRSGNETGEPIALGDAQLATSETDEPAPI